jgi:hypothetical protein
MRSASGRLALNPQLRAERMGFVNGLNFVREAEFADSPEFVNTPTFGDLVSGVWTWKCSQKAPSEQRGSWFETFGATGSVTNR